MSGSDYSGAAWYGAHPNNYTVADRPSSHQINKVVIHVVQGSWSSAINWFNDSRAQVSAHYTVRSSDGYIGQSVHEKDIGWHAGNWDYNQTSVGIEHEGYVNDASWFTDEMYSSSAKLSSHLCKKYGIPFDRQHIVGHVEVPGATHTDPGSYWDWTKYMSLVQNAAGIYSQTVDNASKRFKASSGWGKSTWSSQRYGKNYRYANPASLRDLAKFRVRIPATADYDVYAWWPANSGYNGSVPVRILTSSGAKWLRVDQRKNGGKWVRLGTFNMPAGDVYSVAFSRRTKASGYVIADAVKVVRR
jgi:N-acetyl-anhydromuramyl-L-alanine amidase AmpD